MDSADPLNPQRVFWELSPRLPDNAIITADSGSVANWYARDLKMRRGMKASLSGGLASLGAGTPYAVAAKMAFPDRTVIACMGDGAMQMNGLNVMITISKYWKQWSNPRLIVLVLNNRDLNQVTWEERVQLGDGKTELTQAIPDFPYHKYAELIGLKGIFVDRPGQGRRRLGRGAVGRSSGHPRSLYRSERAAAAAAHHAEGRQELHAHDARRARARQRAEEQRQGTVDQHHPRERLRMHVNVPIGKVRARAFTIPTDKPEADGTIAWNSTTLIVVEVSGGNMVGLAYTYACASITKLIELKLADTIAGLDAMDPPAAWRAMQRAVRNLGREGLAATAISAVDAALYDLKARIIDVPLATLLGAYRNAVPIYGSGGFTTYSDDELQKPAWRLGVARRLRLRQDEGRHRPRRRPASRSGRQSSDRRGDAVCRWQRRLHGQAGSGACRPFLPSSTSAGSRSRCRRTILRGLREIRKRAPAGMDIAAGEYAYTISYVRAMLEAAAVDVQQADVTRCGGVTAFLQIGALCEAFHIDLSGHCAPALHLHVACAVPRLRHLEWFHDHVRIEHMLFEGAPTPRGGAIRPDLSRPGNGLAFKHQDAARYAA